MYVFWTFIVKTHPTEFGENLLWPIKEGVDEACEYLQTLSLTRIVSYKGLWVKTLSKLYHVIHVNAQSHTHI